MEGREVGFGAFEQCLGLGVHKGKEIQNGAKIATCKRCAIVAVYRAEDIFGVKGSVCSVLKFALPPFLWSSNF